MTTAATYIRVSPSTLLPAGKAGLTEAEAAALNSSGEWLWLTEAEYERLRRTRRVDTPAARGEEE